MELMNFKEQIEKLITIKGIDAEVFDVTSRLEVFPERIREIAASLEEKQEGMKKSEEDLKRVQLEKNEKEMDMKAKEEKIAKYESELYNIKNNKEYKALQQEIGSVKADVSLLEEATIKCYDKISEAEINRERETRIYGEEKEKNAKEQNIIKEEEKNLSKHLAELKSLREKETEGIAPDILERYQRLLQNKGRAALSLVQGEMCGECNMQLRPQIINEAKLKKDLVFCENCGRMLYAED